MSELTCGICLDDLRSPVSTPCGHLHCKKCIHEHVATSSDAVQSTCPTCRSPFYTVTLDPTFVPAKYHPFIIPGLRRIYLNADPSRSSATSKQLQEQLSALRKENEDMASKLKSRERDVKLLMTKCESNMAAASAHAKGERDARVENERLRHELDHLAERYNALQDKFSEREHRPGSSVGGDARPKDDRRDHPRNHSSLLIADPPRNVNSNKRFMNKPVPQTGGVTGGTPTVVNKRKYTASTTSTSSLSLSSSESSSTPSSPASNVNREDSIPGGRFLFRPQLRGQMAKRPRLDCSPSRGTASTVQARQTLAPPPVFRRRPATPFNCPPGETVGDQGEGSGYVGGNGDDEDEAGADADTSLESPSDISLASRTHRPRRVSEIRGG